MTRRFTWLLAAPLTIGLMTTTALASAACQRTAPDASNELPFGFVDQPANGASVQRRFNMYGWALDDDGVKEVWVFVDGRFAAKAPIDQSRPDVTKSYPGYRGNTDVHGWAATVSLGSDVQPGNHSIVVQAIDTKGATRDIGSLTVVLIPAN